MDLPLLDVEDITRNFEGVITIRAEDRYNFKPGAADIARGIPDLRKAPDGEQVSIAR